MREGKKELVRCMFGEKISKMYIWPPFHIIFHISNGQLTTFPKKKKKIILKRKSTLFREMNAHSTKYQPHS